eukprot:SAG31_NODE_5181_length_2695_cov_1.832435_4_plen_99_part_00
MVGDGPEEADVFVDASSGERMVHLNLHKYQHDFLAKGGGKLVQFRHCFNDWIFCNSPINLRRECSSRHRRRGHGSEGDLVLRSECFSRTGLIRSLFAC